MTSKSEMFPKGESKINLQSLLGAATDDSFSTARELPPPETYTGVIRDLDVSQFTSTKGDRPRTFTKLQVKWEIDDAGVRELTGLDHPTATQDIFLDVILGPSGELNLEKGKNKNIDLGMLREAVGQNEPGMRWSLEMLKGGIAKIKVDHEVYDASSGKAKAVVKRVAALS